MDKSKDLFFKFDKRDSFGEIERYIDYYSKQGLNIIPVPPKSKRTIIEWKKYQTREVTDEEIKKWFLNPYTTANIAVICGSISENLVVIDFDRAKLADKTYGDGIGKKTLVVDTKKGAHVYFKTKYPVRNFKIPELGIDIKGEGGYVIAPPSIHPSGKKYEERDLIPIKTFEGDLEEDLYRRLKKVKTAACKKFNPDSHRKVVDIDELLKGCSKGNRNEAAIRVATWYRMSELSQKETLEKLKIWNKKNKPPLPLKDLETVTKSAYNPEEPYTFKFSKDATVREQFPAEIEKAAEDLLNRDYIVPFVLKALETIVREEKLKVSFFLLELVKESMDIRGESSSGKNKIADDCFKCFPSETSWKITGASDKSIRYLPKSLTTLYLAEMRAVGRKDEETTAQFDIKLAISEGKLTVTVVEKTEEGRFETKKYETSIENIVSTGTDVSIPYELKNRIWELTTDESKEQSLLVVERALQEEALPKSERINREKEQQTLRCAVQKIYDEAPKEFIIPYAPQLAKVFNMLAAKCRVRRDVRKIIKAIHAGALLHYRTRPHFKEQIVCLPDDLMYVWKYMDDAILGTFTEETKRFSKYWSMIEEILDVKEMVTPQDLSRYARIAPQTARKWLKELEDKGFLIKVQAEGTGGRGRRRSTYKKAEEEARYEVIELNMNDLYETTDKWFLNFEVNELWERYDKKFVDKKIIFRTRIFDSKIAKFIFEQEQKGPIEVEEE